MFDEYHCGQLYDEMFVDATSPRSHYTAVAARLKAMGPGAFARPTYCRPLDGRNRAKA